jgi:hypothetical protein
MVLVALRWGCAGQSKALLAMGSEFSALLNLQPGLNPWLVVLLSSIAGLLTFALSHALYVLHTRHRRLTANFSRLDARVRGAIAWSIVAVLLIALIRAIPGPMLVDGRGWLSGDDLFTVTSRAGFIASYPNTDRKVRKDDPILQLVRDAGPEEIAEATNRRALLAQQLEAARLDVLQIDPMLLAAEASEKGQLDDLFGRRRSLVEGQQSLVRGVQRDKVGNQTKLDEVERELGAARHELDQTESSYKAASIAFETTKRPEYSEIFSKDEIVKREEHAAVLSSRRDELRERIALLTSEQTRLLSLTSVSDHTQGEQITKEGSELEQIDRDIEQAHTRMQAALQAIEEDKVRAEHQRQYRVKQIELEISEYDQLLHAREGALDVRAPWDALVGFREPSPASARLSNRPLLVLYKPGSISVRIHVPADEAQLGSGSRVGINMEALIPEAASSTFAGKIARAFSLPDGSGELQIAGDPPEAAIRELATGSSVPVHVSLRRLNPLAAARIGWVWWLVGAVAAGCLVSEARLWWLRRRLRNARAGDEVPAPSGLRPDWGGDPSEFLEYVVGVGIVSRKLRRAVSPVEDADERRVREPSAVGTASKLQGS